MHPERRLDRRSLLLAGAGLLVAGSACSADDETAQSGRRTTGSGTTGSRTTQPASTAPHPTSAATPAAPTTPPTGLGLPRPKPWTPSSGDLQPGVKVAAARLVEAVGTWSTGHGGPVEGARRVAALGQSRRLGAAFYPPLHPNADAAALEVLEAQYGGLLATTASVLVVTRQWYTDAAGRVSSGGTTVDVRLTRDTPHWRVTAVHPGVLPPSARPVSRLARAVLSEPRIELPPAAQADVASGDVHDSVLNAMLRLARSYRIGVSVVRSGHPTYVFGTDRLSDHPQGRAFDTWRIDGHRVVDTSTPRALVTGYMRAAAKAGSYNVGGPYPLTDGPAQFFTDATHHDHVHIGFSA